MEARKYLKQIKDDGWYLHDTQGATRQYVHKKQPGYLTVCARHNQTLGPETAKAGLTPADADIDGMPEVVVEATDAGASAYCSNLSGVVATGADEMDARERMSEAVALLRRALAGEDPTVD